MTIRNYRDLAVWTKAMGVAKAVYALAELMPKKEEYRLTAQMIRAAISVPANIAEGRTRATRKDFAHFISIARGSTAELETLLMLAVDVAFLSARDVDPVLSDIEEVGRMLNALHAKLKATPNP
ncbi:MAG TPA: four helix bundle protein [Vitreimonas sp.]|uniref:four helix bundle protein n=1 Tax=Vitreimonas sp. TaxID=3069702 RepID=UPI002D6491A7|nr:four helix bundle protein [Vitreimonas sp.]HYD86595.1 four helix bundle protein [Vitreimonas sp.]